MKLQTLRPAGYLAGFLSLLALIAANAGYGTYENGMYDPPPINVAYLAALVVTGGANAMAFLAYWFKWSRK